MALSVFFVRFGIGATICIGKEIQPLLLGYRPTFLSYVHIGLRKRKRITISYLIFSLKIVHIQG